MNKFFIIFRINNLGIYKVEHMEKVAHDGFLTRRKLLEKHSVNRNDPDAIEFESGVFDGFGFDETHIGMFEKDVAVNYIKAMNDMELQLFEE